VQESLPIPLLLFSKKLANFLDPSCETRHVALGHGISISCFNSLNVPDEFFNDFPNFRFVLRCDQALEETLSNINRFGWADALLADCFHHLRAQILQNFN